MSKQYPLTVLLESPKFLQLAWDPRELACARTGEEDRRHNPKATAKQESKKHKHVNIN